MTNERYEIAARLRLARTDANLTLRKAAKQLGIPTSTLRDSETGAVKVTAQRLKALCDLYGVTYEWALTGFDSQVESPEFQEAVGILLSAADMMGKAGRLLKKD